jgi:hypothetical protein
MRMWHLVILLTACGGGSVRESQLPSGEKVFIADCDGDGAKCAALAREHCPDSFGTIEETQATTGPHHLTFRCQRDAPPPAPEAPSTGPSVGEVIGAGIAGGLKGFSEGMNSGGTCSTRSDCYNKQVCLIPKGQTRGTCTEVK